MIRAGLDAAVIIKKMSEKPHGRFPLPASLNSDGLLVRFASHVLLGVLPDLENPSAMEMPGTVIQNISS